MQICFGESSAAKLQAWAQKHYEGALQLTVRTRVFFVAIQTMSYQHYFVFDSPSLTQSAAEVQTALSDE